MADLSKIKLPDNTIYDIRDANKSGCYTVIGTQTESTSAWTGSIPIPHLYTGLSIDYYLPCDSASSGVTLNLTLSDGATTGGTQCYINPDTVATAQCKAGQVIHMTYYSAGSISINGSTITSNRWIFDSFPECQDIIDENVAILEATPGKVCSFSNAAPGVNLNALKVAINATQSGSGTPAPDNIRPIIGVSECNVVRCGKNLFNKTTVTLNTRVNTSGTTAYPSIDCSDFIKVPTGDIYISNVCGISLMAGVYIYNKDKEYVRYESGGTTSLSKKITIASGECFIRLNINHTDIDICQVELGSTATAYEAYTGNTYIIQLGDTYYGGSLDVTNGVFTATHIKRGVSDLPFVLAARIGLLGGYYFNADCNLNYYGIPQCKYVASEGAAILASELFNMGTITNPYNSTSNCAFIFKLADNRIGVRIGFTDIQTIDDFNAIKDNIEICYELATPITVQLTPTQVEQFLGANNVWADTGDVEELKYYTDSQAIQIIDTLSKQNSGVHSVTINDKYLRVDTNGFETDLVVPYSDTTGGVIRATMESTSTATAFVLTAPNITSLYDGLTIVAKNTVIASASGCTISLNGLDAKGIWLSQSNSACTTHWAKNVTYIFVYDATNERWELQQGRDTDLNDIQTIRMYYTYFTAGSHGLMNRGLCAKLRDSDTYSSFTTTSGTGSKTYNTTDSFDLSKIYCFSGTSDIAAGATNGANTINLSFPLTDLRYTLNGVTTKAATSVLTAKKPVYLLFDKDCKLCSPYFTQDLYNLDFDDASDWGVEYAVLIGITNDIYRMDLLMVNPTYKVYSREWYTDPTYGDVHLVPTFKPEYCSSIEENKLVWTNSNPHASATITGTTTTVTSEYLPLYSRIRIDFFPVYAMYAAVPFYVDIPKSVNSSQAVMVFFNYAAKNGLRQLEITKLSDTSFKIDWYDGGRYDTYGSNTPTIADSWGIPYKIYLCN